MRNSVLVALMVCIGALMSFNANAQTQLSVTGETFVSNRTYDGTTNVTFTQGSLVGVSTGDVVTLNTTAKFNSKNANNNAVITVTYSISGKDAGKYTAPATKTVSGKIYQMQLTAVTNTTTTKQYDRSNVAISQIDSIKGIVTGDNVTLSHTALYDDKNVGTGKTITVHYILSGTDANNYKAPADTKTYNGIITAVTTGISSAAVLDYAKTYDGTTDVQVVSNGTASGLLAGDDVQLSASAYYSSAKVGGNLDITLTYGFTGTDAGNYIVPAGDVFYGVGSIVPKQLSIGTPTAVAASKTYDGTTSCQVTQNGTLSGVAAGDNVTLLVTANYENAQAGTGKNVNVSYAIAGVDSANYLCPNGTVLKADINPLKLQMSTPQVVASKVYDGTTTTTVTSVGAPTNLLSGDNVSVSATAAYDNKNVGTGKVIYVTYSISGANAANYDVPDVYTLHTGVVTSRMTSVTGLDVTKDRPYNGNTTAVVKNSGVVDKVEGDDVTVSASAVFDDKYVGTSKQVTVSFTLSGTDAGNYSINDSILAGSITCKNLTISRDARVQGSKVYDGGTSCTIAQNGALKGAVSGESVSLKATAAYADALVGDGKIITITYSLAGADSANYKLYAATKDTTGAITPLDLRLMPPTVQSSKVYDGNTSCVVTAVGSMTNLVAGDNVTVTGTAVYDDKNVGAGNKDVYVSYTLYGTSSGNYTIMQRDTVHYNSITKATTTVSGTTVQEIKVYDGTTAATVDNPGTVDVITGDVVTVSNAVATYDNKNVGTGKTITVKYTLSGTDAGNYNVTDGTFATGSITRKSLTIAQDATVTASKIYDGNTVCGIAADGTLSGVESGDNVTLVATAAYDDASVDNGKRVTITYSLAGRDTANYILQTTTATTTADITPLKLLLHKPTVQTTKTYDGTTDATVTAVGQPKNLLPGDVVNVDATAVYDDKNVGNGKDIIVSYSLYGASAGNYDAPANDTVHGNSITRATTTITGTDVQTSKTYDRTTAATVNDAGTVVVFQLDDVTATAVAAYDNKNVGTGKTITIKYTLGGGDAANYDVADVMITGEITRKQLTVSPDATVQGSKVYDGNTNCAVTSIGTLTGVENGDVVTHTATAVYGNAAVGQDKGVTITYSLAGADTANYELSSETAATTADITPLKLQLQKPTVQTTKTYDGTTEATVTAVGQPRNLLSGDVVNVQATAVYEDKNVGNGKNIIVSYTLSGAGAGNYDTPANDTVSGNSITRATTTITGTDVQTSKTYDRTTDATVNDAGTVVVFHQDNVTATAVAAYDNKNVGTGKTITVKYTLGGTDAANYDVADVTMTGEITRKQLTVSPDATVQGTKVYDGNTNCTVTSNGTLNGVVSGDIVTHTATAAYSDAAAGQGKTVAITYALGGVDTANYVILPSTAATTADITPLKLQLLPPTVQTSKTYDGTTSATVTAVGQPMNLLSGDVVNVQATAVYDDKNVGNSKDIIVSYTLYGTNAVNYGTPDNDTVHSTSITKATTTVDGTQVRTTKVYDGTADAVVIEPGAAVVFGQDSVAVTAVATFDNRNVGTGKTITVKYTLSGTDAGNYYVADVTETGDITSKQLTITKDATIQKTKVYDGNTLCNITANGTLDGVESGDNVMLVSSAAYDNATVGRNKNVTVTYSLSGLDTANYKLAATTANMKAHITQLQLQLQAPTVQMTKTYDGTTSATVTAVGQMMNLLSGDAVVVTGTAVYDDKNVGNSKDIYVSYSLSGTSAGNYSTPDNDTVHSASITKQTTTIEGTQVRTVRVYDGTVSATVDVPGTVVVFGQDNVTATAVATFDNRNVGTGKSVTVKYTLHGVGSANYSVSDVVLTGEITRKTLTITQDAAVQNTKVYDGNTLSNIIANGTLDGVESGDDVTLVSNAAYVNANVGQSKPVTITYTLSGVDTANYRLATVTATTTADITKLKLQLLAPTVQTTKVYDGTVDATVNAVGGMKNLLSGDVVNVSATAVYDDKNVGNSKDILVTYSLYGTDAGNYDVPDNDTVHNNVITKATTKVEGTQVHTTKEYDGNADAVVINPGTVAVFGQDSVTASAVATFDDSNVGTGKTITVRYTLSGRDAGNYSVADSIMTGAINRKQLTVSQDAAVQGSKVYDGTTSCNITANGVLTGIVSGDYVDLVSSASYVDAAVGTGKTVNLSYSLAGIDTANYLLPVNTGTATADITQLKMQLLQPSVQTSKVYDATTTATMISCGAITNLQAGDTVYVTALANYDNKNVGTNSKDIYVTYTLQGKDAGNYSTPDNDTVHYATITPAATRVTGTVVNLNRVYNGNNKAVVKDPGTVAVFGQDIVTATAVATYDNKNVGTGKAITVVYTLHGQDSANYTVADSLLTGNITQKQLSIEQDAIIQGSKVYDGNTACTITTNGTISGVVNGDNVILNQSAVYDTKYVGQNKNVTVNYSLAGIDSANYKLKTLTSGKTADITQLQLQVAPPIVQPTKVYDGTTSCSVTATGRMTNLVPGDSVDVNATAVYDNKNVGNNKDVYVSYTLYGRDMGNYSAPKVDTAHSDITPLATRVVNTDVQKTRAYNGKNVAVVNNPGTVVKIGQDDVTATAVATFDNKNVGTNKVITVVYTLHGADSANYTVTDSIMIGSITRKLLTVSQGATVKPSKVYDGNDSCVVLQYGAVSGVVNGENVDLVPTAKYDTRDAGTNKTVTITYSLSGNDTANYALQSATTTTTADITPLGLTVLKPSVRSGKRYDGNTSCVVDTVGRITNLISGDTVVVSALAVYDNKSVGQNKDVYVSYTLRGRHAGNYTAPDNDTLPGNTIWKDTTSVIGLTVLQSKVYDGNTTATVTNAGTVVKVVASDEVNVSAVATYDNKNVGSSKVITVVFAMSGSDAANYYLSDSTMDGSITRKTLTISQKAQIQSTKVYDGTTGCVVTQNGTLKSGVLSGDDVRLDMPVATYDDRNVGQNKAVTVVYSLTGVDTANYAFQATMTTTMSIMDSASITQRQLHVTGDQVEDEKDYDGTTTAAVLNNGTLDAFAIDSLTLTTTATYDNVFVGPNKTITISYNVTGPGVGNYILPASRTMTGTINGAVLPYTISAVHDTIYNGTNRATVEISNIVKLDPTHDVTLIPSAHFSDANAGNNKTVYVSFTLSGANAGYYRVPSDTTLTGNILPKQLTVSGTQVALTKVYDGTDSCAVTADGTLSGIIGNDNVTFAQVTATFADKNVGQNKSVTVSYQLGGIEAGNYLAPIDTQLTSEITVKTLTIDMPFAGLTLTKEYDANKVVQGTAAGTLLDVVAGDIVNLQATSALYNDSAIGNGKPITVVYALNGGVDAGNYILSQGTFYTTGDITQRTLTLVYNANLTKVYDATTTVKNFTTSAIALTNTVQGQDSVVFNLISAVYDDKNVGSDKEVYVQYLLTGPDSSKYKLGDATGNVVITGEITPMELSAPGTTVTDKVYDGTDVAPIINMGSIGRIYKGDDLTVTATATFSDYEPGTVTATIHYVMSGEDKDNYVIEDETKAQTYTIYPKTIHPQNVRGAKMRKTYDATDAVLGTITMDAILPSEIVNNENVTLSVLSALYDDKNVGTKKRVTISYQLGGTDASHYQVADSVCNLGEIDAYQLFVDSTAVKCEKNYDGTATAQVTRRGILSPRLGSDNVDFKASAYYDDAMEGDYKTIYVSYTLTGTDRANYWIETPVFYTDTAKIFPEGTGVEVVSEPLTISLAPNPIKAGGVTYLYVDAEVGSVDVVNASGQSVTHIEKPGLWPLTIDGPEVTGVYFIRVITANGEVHIRKLIVD